MTDQPEPNEEQFNFAAALLRECVEEEAPGQWLHSDGKAAELITARDQARDASREARLRGLVEKWLSDAKYYEDAIRSLPSSPDAAIYRSCKATLEGCARGLAALSPEQATGEGLRPEPSESPTTPRQDAENAERQDDDRAAPGRR